jgi:transcriptional regulator with XRE-family HTH domain
MSNESHEVVPEWTIGDRMLKSRTVAGLTQTELADYLGMSRVSLSRYETGHNRPPLTVLRLWAMRCGVPLDWLRYGDAPPLPDVVAGGPNPRPKRPPSTKWSMSSALSASGAAAA